MRNLQPELGNNNYNLMRNKSMETFQPLICLILLMMALFNTSSALAINIPLADHYTGLKQVMDLAVEDSIVKNPIDMDAFSDRHFIHPCRTVETGSDEAIWS